MRSKIILLFSLLGLVPALLVSAVIYLSGESAAKENLRIKVGQEVEFIKNSITKTLEQRQKELNVLSHTQTLRDFINDTKATEKANRLKDLVQVSRFEKIKIVDAKGNVVFDYDAKSPSKNISSPANIVDNELADKNVWITSEDKSLQPRVVKDGFVVSLRFTTPIFTDANKTAGYALVADTTCHSLASGFNLPKNDNSFTLVVDKAGYILHHSNHSFLHQTVNSAFPSSSENIYKAIQRGENGWQFYEANNARWLIVYSKISGTDLSVAAAENFSAINQSWQIAPAGFSLIVLSAAIAILFIWLVVGKHTRNLERVAEGTAAIAKGNLEKNIAALSSDDLQSLGLNLNIITERFRAQVRREAEMQQLNAFTRLTAMLTHDLKNSITTLSMLVNNLDEHYENEAFRVDAMKSLRGTADKLQTMLVKLSQPTMTLSSEIKLPLPNDIVAIIKRVVAVTAEQNPLHEIELKLPEKLMVKIDPDKIDKVVENLVINSLEAMGDTEGKITIEAGKINEKESFFSVTDTGSGMSEKFQKEKLFHPFATTKKKGIGLGLYSCQEIVTAHGGRIEVESKLNSGTTFKVVLLSA